MFYVKNVSKFEFSSIIEGSRTRLSVSSVNGFCFNKKVVVYCNQGLGKPLLSVTLYILSWSIKNYPLLQKSVSSFTFAPPIIK